MTTPSLAPLRLKLTAWYFATLGVILLLLGGGLFLAIRRQYAQDLDASLRDSALRLERAARIREQEAGARGRVVDAVEELRIPHRALYLLDTAGTPVTPATADPWIRTAARAAAVNGRTDVNHHAGRERVLRLHAERFALGSGTPLVAAAVADRVELEDRYAALIATFGGAALAAMVLVAAASWVLVRQATAPIERNIARMQRFMADAAHELRTPVTVLRTRAEVALQRERDPAAYVESLRGIESESRRLAAIVDDLLLLARSDSGQRPIAMVRVSLDDLIMDAVGAAGVVASPRGVAVTVGRLDEASVQGDAELLRQLLMIVLDNAVKFTPAGGRVTVTVVTDGGKAVVTVRDTGTGISADELPKIFERFYRGDPARRRAAGVVASGAGLGLSIARWIVGAHGAAIDVTSTPDQGTAVAMTFDAVPPGPVSSS
ncbi:MAG: sensor histidine kinase [Gemmatimonadales bacterium]